MPFKRTQGPPIQNDNGSSITLWVPKRAHHWSCNRAPPKIERNYKFTTSFRDLVICSRRLLKQLGNYFRLKKVCSLRLDMCSFRNSLVFVWNCMNLKQDNSDKFWSSFFFFPPSYWHIITQITSIFDTRNYLYHNSNN